MASAEQLLEFVLEIHHYLIEAFLELDSYRLVHIFYHSRQAVDRFLYVGSLRRQEIVTFLYRLIFFYRTDIDFTKLAHAVPDLPAFLDRHRHHELTAPELHRLYVRYSEVLPQPVLVSVELRLVFRVLYLKLVFLVLYAAEPAAYAFLFGIQLCRGLTESALLRRKFGKIRFKPELFAFFLPDRCIGVAAFRNYADFFILHICELCLPCCDISFEFIQRCSYPVRHRIDVLFFTLTAVHLDPRSCYLLAYIVK